MRRLTEFDELDDDQYQDAIDKLVEHAHQPIKQKTFSSDLRADA
jgi:hypothetical protein